MPGAVVGWLFDSVLVVAGAFDDAGVGAVVSGRVQVAGCGDVGHHLCEEVVAGFRGKKPAGH